MFKFEDPSIGFALLAIIIGLRLALYLVERLLEASPAHTATPTLSPDDIAFDSALPIADAPEPTSAPAKVNERPLHFLTEVLDSAFIAVALVFFLIRPFILQAFFIPSGSMIPTLLVNDRLLATKYSYNLREPRRQEIVVFHAPPDAIESLGQAYDTQHPTDYVKRVIGLPRDHIRVIGGDGLYVNGVKQIEPYITDIPERSYPLLEDGTFFMAGYNEAYQRIRAKMLPYVQGNELVVPEGYLFVMGDNRNSSHDSRDWGLLPRKSLVGKAVFIFWPPDRLGFVR